MNISIRKLELLERAIDERVECAKIQGYSGYPADNELRQNIAALLLKIRTV